ncbi:MAG TPA: hypothetical protein VG711_00465 [Phycisphaerales bacterium]|nr:hypothetical protein [Phycisphaerales bacterium]
MRIRTSALRALAVVVVAGIMLAGSGCARSVSQTSLVDSAAGPNADLDFWDKLQTDRTVTNHDALHALILLADGEDHSTSFQERVDVAKKKNWISADRQLTANESATVGDISVALCQILDIRGGLTLTLFGPSRRYCTRELVYREVIPARTESQSMSGLELLNLIGNAEDYRKNGFIPNQHPNYGASFGS